MLAQEPARLEQWLAHISETDQVAIAHLLPLCQRIPSDKQFFLSKAKRDVPSAAIEDERRTCQQCANPPHAEFAMQRIAAKLGLVGRIVRLQRYQCYTRAMHWDALTGIVAQEWRVGTAKREKKTKVRNLVRTETAIFP